MTREEKLEAIYKDMANKELTLGCKLTVVESFWPCNWVVFYSDSLGSKVLRDDWRRTTETKNNDFSIIWHPVMIGDVLDWIERKMGISNHEYEESIIEEANMAVLLWGEYLKPIEEQSDECIDYVYSLIQKN